MEKKQITKEEALVKIGESYDQLEGQRAASLEETRMMQDIRTKAQTKERERLVKKYGESHPRVKKINARINYTTNFTPLLETHIDFIQRKLPPIGKNSWRVQGRVLKANTFIPLEGFTVSLFTDSGKWVRQLGHDCTDIKGYYALTYDAKKNTDEAVYYQDNADLNTGSKTRSTPNLFLTVTDNNQAIIHTEKEPVILVPNQVVYRDIILDEEACEPPTDGNGSKPTEPNGDRPPGSKDDSTGKEDDGKSGKPSAPVDKIWTVRGTVVDNSNQPMAGLNVSLYDKGHSYDEKLGKTRTDKVGKFRFDYNIKTVPDLFKKSVDIYLKVMDAKGETLYSTRKAVPFGADREKEFNIKIKGK